MRNQYIEPPITDVVFRVDSTGEVAAVFPRETHLSGAEGRLYACYVHNGQHGSCSRAWYDRTRPATEDEYAELRKELERIGYTLNIRARANWA